MATRPFGAIDSRPGAAAPRDGRVAPQHAHHSVERGAERRARAVVRPRADDRDQRIAALAVEVPVDQPAGLHGLRAVGLPAAAGERVLGARSEHAEADGDADPGEHDRAAVGGRPAAEATESDRRVRAVCGADTVTS